MDNCENPSGSVTAQQSTASALNTTIVGTSPEYSSISNLIHSWIYTDPQIIEKLDLILKKLEELEKQIKDK